MKKVFEQYIDAISKQIKRRNRQGRTEFTASENKALEYYGRAAQQLEALINAPTPSWVGFKFEKKQY